MTEDKYKELRKRAEEILLSENNRSAEDSNYSLQTALHELKTHQVELELQNEELRRTQEELIKARDQYIDLYDFAPVGYLSVDDKNTIIEANLTLADMLGEDRQSLYGQPFSRFISPKDQDIFYKHFRVLIAARLRRCCELWMRRKNGEFLWAKLECVPKEQDNTSSATIRIALHDITDSKLLETEIINAKKFEATAHFAGGIAHDFNNLLAVILGNLELVQSEIPSDQSIAQQLLAAQSAGLSAADLTRKFLRFAEGGQPVKKPAAIETLIVESASLSLAGSNVHFECAFPEGLWAVEVDAQQVILAISNVITNAKETMPQGGMITIRAENIDPDSKREQQLQDGQSGKCVSISVKDRGVSIPQDILHRIFDPYFSSKKARTNKGIGLGLTIAQSIIKKHGGTISIASQPNIGTTVIISLPACDKTVTSQKSYPRRILSLNRKILIMEDDEMIRRVSRVMLEHLGYSVEDAGNGEEAIRIYSQARREGSPFGTVILDLTIKEGMGGEETMRRLKELDPDIKAIVASGYSADPIMTNFREHGFIAALHKPFQLKDLMKIMEM